MAEKWSEQRIAAWKRYIQTDKIELESWERNLKQSEEAVNRAKSMIESKKKSIDIQIKELAEQETIK